MIDVIGETPKKYKQDYPCDDWGGVPLPSDKGKYNYR